MSSVFAKDNSALKDTEVGLIPTIIKRVGNKPLQQLADDEIFLFPHDLKDSQDLDRDKRVLQYVEHQWHTTNVIGVLTCADERLEINSRFTGDENQGYENSYFLRYLLSRVIYDPNVVDFPQSSSLEDELFHLLVFSFPEFLQTAMRKGCYKVYARRELNALNVRGAIDVARHLRLNTPFVGRIAFNVREFTYDNPLMELVRHTIEFIRSKPYGPGVLNRAQDEVREVVKVTNSYRLQDRQKVIHFNMAHPVLHSYYSEYRTLQNLCLKILRAQKSFIGFNSIKTYGILFDVAWLWEEYINTIFRSQDKEDTFDWLAHPQNKAKLGKQFLFLDRDSEEQKGPIYPDFFGQLSGRKVVLDAKYKPIRNISNKDYLQVLAYMLRFEADSGFYLYPDNEFSNQQSASQVLWLQRGFDRLANKADGKETHLKEGLQTQPRFVAKIGLKIPKPTGTYSDFVQSMKKSEQAFRSTILKVHADPSHTNADTGSR